VFAQPVQQQVFAQQVQQQAFAQPIQQFPVQQGFQQQAFQQQNFMSPVNYGVNNPNIGNVSLLAPQYNLPLTTGSTATPGYNPQVQVPVTYGNNQQALVNPGQVNTGAFNQYPQGGQAGYYPQGNQTAQTGYYPQANQAGYYPQNVPGQVPNQMGARRTLLIRPTAAQLTRNTEWMGKMDPMAQIQIGNQTYKTAVANNAGLTPVWTDTFTHQLTGGESTLNLTVFDVDTMSNDVVGQAVIPLNEVMTRGASSQWYDINYNGAPAGKVQLNMQLA